MTSELAQSYISASTSKVLFTYRCLILAEIRMKEAPSKHQTFQLVIDYELFLHEATRNLMSVIRPQ